MALAADTEPLTSFLSDYMSYLSRLRTTGRPIVLTIQDRPRLVVQDAEAYQRLIDLINELDAEHRLRKHAAPPGAADPPEPVERTASPVPQDRVLANMRKQLKRNPKT